jgi:hypothetical protein
LGYAVLIVNLKRGGHAIQELDTVVLTHDVPEHSLKEGDLGAFVHIHAEEETAEVEFVRQMGVNLQIWGHSHDRHERAGRRGALLMGIDASSLSFEEDWPSYIAVEAGPLDTEVVC